MKKDLLKFPLKRVLLSTVILCSLSAIISSCGEEEGRISVNDAAPEKVTNVTTKAGPGEVTLSWTNPASSSFMYTKIEYTNAKGEKQVTQTKQVQLNFKLPLNPKDLNL